MALRRVWIPSPNYSSRGGAGVRLLVLHTAQGARTYQSLGSYFQGPVGVSSHVGIDDTANTVGEYVSRGHKAWTASGANPVACQAELCAFAEWDSVEWHRHPNMLSSTAAWLAEEAAAFGIPLVKLTAAQAQSNGRGVCQHVDLGAWGGGHWDCGPSFPIDEVLAMAGGQAGGAPTPPTPTPTLIGDNMVITDPETGGIWVVASKEGSIYTYGGAPYLGGTNNTHMNAARYPCAGITDYKDGSGAGYMLVLDWGDRGDGHSHDGGERFRRYRFPRNGSGKAPANTGY